MNPWHDIDEKRITPEDFLAIIEIPKNTRKKYEIDKDTGMLILDRILSTSTRYPCNYGFIPKTLSEDGDPLDVLVLCMDEIHPLTLIECKPIGLIEMIDNGERDEKIIAVPVADPQYNFCRDIDDLPEHTFLEIEHFLKVYKDLQKDNIVEIRPIQNRDAAITVIKDAKVLYNKKFGGKKK